MAMRLADNPGHLAPMRRRHHCRAPSREMRLDDFRDPRRACLVIEVAQDCARIEDIRHHLFFSCRRWRFSSWEREGLPEKRPRVLSTSSSATVSRTMLEPACVTEMRVPGLIPSNSRISEGMTNWPFVLTDVICRIVLTL